jgi:hypothetical protein
MGVSPLVNRTPAQAKREVGRATYRRRRRLISSAKAQAEAEDNKGS